MQPLLEKEKDEILHLHALWLRSEGEEGERADLSNRDLFKIELQGKNLTRACFHGANLNHAFMAGAKLREADLSHTDLSNAYLFRADLRGANLRGANLREANLGQADLEGADFYGADWNRSSFPLSRGTYGLKGDDCLAAQLIYHLTQLDLSQCSNGVQEAVEHIKAMAIAELYGKFHPELLRHAKWMM